MRHSNRASGSDAELVRRARNGDRDAFDALIWRHLEGAYAVAYALLRDPADAEDACQDAFVTALRRVDDCRPERFRAWLMEVVRNRAHNLRRASRLRAADPLPAGVAASARTEQVAEGTELRGHIEEAMQSLTPLRRSVFNLHDVDGLRHREVAEILRISEQSARVALHKARQTLRRLLAPRYRENGHAG